MAFKIIFVVAALLACVSAKPGGPAAYSISVPAVDHESVGQTQEHTVKGHYGQSSQSDYSSQVQTAHSQSHVQRSSISNDGGYAPGHVVAAAAPVTAHAYAAPVASYAPALSHGYAAAPALSYAQAAPALSYGHTAPALSLAHGGYSSYAAPALSHGYAAAAPAISYAAPAVYGANSYGHAYASAPALQLTSGHYGGYAAAPALSQGYYSAAPAISTLKVAAAPAYAHGAIGYAAAPAIGYAHAPAISAHYAAPLVKAAIAGPALVHTSVAGHGVHYGVHY